MNKRKLSVVPYYGSYVETVRYDDKDITKGKEREV